jgi:hypothetical protein
MSKCTIKDGKHFAPNGAESLLFKELREKVGQEEANNLFILSQTPTFIRDVVSPMMQSYIKRIPSFPEAIKFKETFVGKIRTFHIYEGRKKVGRIQVTPYKDGFKIKSSLVNEEERGKGYGKYLYYYTAKKLISENNTLYTDTKRTEDADRIWNSLYNIGLTQDKRTVRPFPETFDENGEVLPKILLDYVENRYSELSPLSTVEKTHLINLQITGIENSTQLYKLLYGMFYKDGIFNPDVKKLEKIYYRDEINTLLTDVEVLARARETVDKLKNTEEFEIPQIKFNPDFDFRSPKLNILGQYKRENPLRLEKLAKEEGMNKIPVLDEKGVPQKTKMFFEKAIKPPTNEILRAVGAVVNAHPMVDTIQIENRLIKSFKNFGMDLEGLERGDFSTLLDYLEYPSTRTREALEDALGFVREPQTFPTELPSNRSYVYLKTTMSEQELFDELSLVKTGEPNIFHQINKVSEEELRQIQKNKNLAIPEYQLYKDYFGYTSNPSTRVIQTNIETDVEYLKGDFIADFAAEKLKTPTEFNRQFKITDSGIELVSDDLITLEIVKAYIQDNKKFSKEIADYSLLSKDMPNLKPQKEFYQKTVQDKRIEAVNNIETVQAPKTAVDIIDEESFYAPQETAKFLKVAEELYEQQEQGYYTKIEKNNDPNFYEMNPSAPQTKDFDLKQEEKSEVKIKTLAKTEDLADNFQCA